MEANELKRLHELASVARLLIPVQYHEHEFGLLINTNVNHFYLLPPFQIKALYKSKSERRLKLQ